MPQFIHRGHAVPFSQIVFELIDMRSFSNLWYWIALAVLWSSASHWVLGVPFDMVTRARRTGGEAAADLETLVTINVRRRLTIARVAGLWLVGTGAAVLTTLGLLGFVYGLELAQAVFLMAAPMSVVGIWSHRTARILASRGETGEALWRRLTWHRLGVQVIGVIAIFVTALWGIWSLMRAAFPGF